MGIAFFSIILAGGILLGPGLLSAVIAHYKGYRPWYWVLSSGLLGMVIILIVPSLGRAATPEQREKWESRADWTGGILSGLTFVSLFAVVMLAALFFVGAAAPLRVKTAPVVTAPTTASPTMDDVELEGEVPKADPPPNSKPE
jgi:hypothetical protein